MMGMEETQMATAHSGEDGKNQPRLMKQLSKKSREELLALLEQLLQRQPEIEPLLESGVKPLLSKPVFSTQIIKAGASWLEEDEHIC